MFIWPKFQPRWRHERINFCTEFYKFYFYSGMRNVYQLADNPLLCDCSLEWALNSHVISDLANVTCHHHDQSVSHVSQMTRDTFLCHYDTHCFSLCRCCTFLACDCRMNCPDTCTCLHDEVSCHYLDHKVLLARHIL